MHLSLLLLPIPILYNLNLNFNHSWASSTPFVQYLHISAYFATGVGIYVQFPICQTWMSLATRCNIAPFGLLHATKSLVWWYRATLLCSIPDTHQRHCTMLPLCHYQLRKYLAVNVAVPLTYLYHARLIVTWVSVPIHPARTTSTTWVYNYWEDLVQPLFFSFWFWSNENTTLLI